MHSYFFFISLYTVHNRFLMGMYMCMRMCTSVLLCSIHAPSIYLPNLLFCGIHCHVYRAYLLLLRTSYPFAHPKFISDASNLFSVSPIVPQRISLRIRRARFLALGRMMKRDMKRCLLRIVSARGSISNRFDELQAIKEALTISRSAPP